MQHNLHDVVRVQQTHKEHSWRNNVVTGVVICFDEKKVEVKDRYGITTEVDLLDENYTLEVIAYSEVQFKEDIIKAIAEKKKALGEAEDELAQAMAWQHVFTYEVSVLGKLMRTARDHFRL
jgi:hypothetical protein